MGPILKYVVRNGQIFSSATGILNIENRGFKYGDGFFETIRLKNGLPCFMAEHWARIRQAAKALKMNLPKNLDSQDLFDNIAQLAFLNQITEGGRVRITFTRQSGGAYQPISNDVDYVIEQYKLAPNLYTVSPKGLSTDIYWDLLKPINALAHVKSTNALIYVMASIHAQEIGLDDVILVNDKQNLCEGTSSNLFLIYGDTLVTPPLTEGCVAGIMRTKIIQSAEALHISVEEKPLSLQNAADADGALLTNVIQGIRWIRNMGEHTFEYTHASPIIEKIYALLNQET